MHMQRCLKMHLAAIQGGATQWLVGLVRFDDAMIAMKTAGS